MRFRASRRVSTGGAVTYVGEQAGAPATGALSGLNRLLSVRHFTLPQNLANTFSITVALSYGTNDFLTNPSGASQLVAKSQKRRCLDQHCLRGDTFSDITIYN